MKKILTLLIFFFMLFSLTGCKDGEIVLPDFDDEIVFPDDPVIPDIPDGPIDNEFERISKELYKLALESGYKGNYEKWLFEIKGEAGDCGKEIVLDILNDVIVWRYNSDVEWQKLVSIDELKAKISPSGFSAYDAYLKNHPNYHKTEEEWLRDLINNDFKDFSYVKVIFSTNKLYKEEHIIANTLILEPTAPVLEKHTFIGWFLGEKQWNFEVDKVTTDIILEAKFKRNDSFCVTFNSQGGSTIAKQFLVPGESLSNFVPIREGYEFLGWYKTQKCLETDLVTNMPNDDITLYAGWKELPKVDLEAMLNLINLEADHHTISRNFTLPTVLKNDGISLEITWKSLDESLLIFKKTPEDINETITGVINPSEIEQKIVEFTATITYNGQSATRNFKTKLEKVLPSELMLDYFHNGKFENNELLMIKGYLSGKQLYDEARNTFSAYILDLSKKGSYFAYRISATKEEYDNLHVGDSVIIEGHFYMYFNTPEIKNGVIKHNYDIPNIKIDPIDITDELVEAAISGNISKVTDKYLSSLVKIDGFQVIDTKMPSLEIHQSSPIIFARRAGLVLKGVLNANLIDSSSEEAKKLGEYVTSFKNGSYINYIGFLEYYRFEAQLALIGEESIVKEDNNPNYSVNEKILDALSRAEMQFPETFNYAQEFDLITKDLIFNNIKISYIISTTNDIFNISNNKLIINSSSKLETIELIITARYEDISFDRIIELKFMPPATYKNLQVRDKSINISDFLY